MGKDNNDQIDDLPGVGPATAEKLRDAGYTDIMSIAVASPKELSDAAEVGESSGAKIIQGARKLADVGKFETGSILLEKRGNKGFGFDPIFIPTGEEQSFAEMSLTTKNLYSHRQKSLREMFTSLTAVENKSISGE